MDRWPSLAIWSKFGFVTPVFLDTFDPTQSHMRGGYVIIGYGRDAADVAINNQFGPPVYPIYQNIQVQRIEEKDI